MPKLSTLVLSTDREVQAAKLRGTRAEYRIKGARNLILRVTAHGARTWQFYYRCPATQKWRRIAIGTYPAIGLAQAKDDAMAMAVSVNQGHDPLAARQVARDVLTFKALVDAYMAEHERKNARDGQPSRWTNEAQRLFNADILPAIGGYRAEAVARERVVEILDGINARGAHVVADKALALVRATYAWGVAAGKLPPGHPNPTAGMEKSGAGQPRERTLTEAEIRTFWFASSEFSPEVRDALRLQLLLAVRVNEATGAAKCEVDFDKRLWTIPGLRTKNGAQHRLPLPPQAATILRAAVDRSNGSPWVFPSSNIEGPLRGKSAMRALLRARDEIGLVDVGTHDLRRTCATGLGDLNVRDEIISHILNHSPTGVTRRHYNHATYLEPMREALEAWDRRIAEIVAGSA
jgi:integrase